MDGKYPNYQWPMQPSTASRVILELPGRFTPRGRSSVVPNLELTCQNRGMAPVAHVLFSRVLRRSPAHHDWLTAIASYSRKTHEADRNEIRFLTFVVGMTTPVFSSTSCSISLVMRSQWTT